MSDLSHLGIKLPWYSDEYLEDLQTRYPEIVGGKTRQELFKILYESVDRESPNYENEFLLALEVYDLLNNSHPDVEVEEVYETTNLELAAKNPNRLYYLFNALPEPNLLKLSAAIDAAVENIGSSYLIIGALNETDLIMPVNFSRSEKIEEIHFATFEGYEKHYKSTHTGAPLLALSISLDDEKTPGVATLDTHVIRRSLGNAGEPYVLHKRLSFDEFVELFNQADWGI